MFSNAGHRLLLTHALSNLGRIAARGGELDDAHRLLNEALAIAEEISSASLVDEVKTRLAEWAVLARKPEEALEVVEAALAGIRESGGGSLQNALAHRHPRLRPGAARAGRRGAARRSSRASSSRAQRTRPTS